MWDELADLWEAWRDMGPFSMLVLCVGLGLAGWVILNIL
jgi:hypothetical protein